MVNLLKDMSNQEIIEYLKLALELNVNSSYINLIQEEIYSRMKGGAEA